MSPEGLVLDRYECVLEVFREFIILYDIPVFRQVYIVCKFTLIVVNMSTYFQCVVYLFSMAPMMVALAWVPPTRK